VKILTRENSLANYFEEATKVGRKHNVNPKQIANHLINRNININSVLPAKLIEAIVKSNQTEQIDENKLNTIIGDVLKNNQKAVADYQAGKENAVMFLIGQVIRHAKQKLDTKIIKEKLEKKLIK
jgi:Asp-tRNA(Asn)/Glu-tRNA(Gln) amidotransferase B subunit